MTAVRAAGTPAPGVRRLRTVALLELATHPELTPSVLAHLRATQVHQSGTQGEIYLRIPRAQALLLVRLAGPQQSALLEYLEAARLWGENGKLFPSRRSIIKALSRGRRRASR